MSYIYIHINYCRLVFNSFDIVTWYCGCPHAFAYEYSMSKSFLIIQIRYRNPYSSPDIPQI